MSVKEIEAAANEWAEAFSKNDLNAILNLFSEDVEIFDHVPYRFDNKQEFKEFLEGAMQGGASGRFSFRQLSCRMIGENAAVANAYDTYSGTVGGQPLNMHGRTTLVYAKEAGQWKVVSAHLSPMPKQ